MKRYSKYTAAVCLSLGMGFGIQSVQAQAAAKKAPEAKGPSLKAGDAIPANALEGVTWVQGEEVKSFDEKGKVYIIENWATWCGPCIAVIPHVNELNKKYADKGLVIVGMNVWEDGLEKVQDFVKKQGDGMSYRVAYSGGKSSKFTDRVLKPAGVRGIPHALIVRDGKLMVALHPSKIDDALIEEVMGGSFDGVAYEKKQAAAEKAQAELSAKIRPLIQKGDWDGLKALANGMEDGDRMKPMLLVKATVEKSDWAGLLQLRKDFKDGRFGKSVPASFIDSSVVREAKITDGAADFAKVALAEMKPLKAGAKSGVAFEHHFNKARLEFMVGNKEVAASELKETKEVVAKMDEGRAKSFYTAIVNSAIAKVAEGSFPTMNELQK